MVNGIECGKEIQKGKGSDRPFGHIEQNIVMDIKEATFSRMVFSINRFKGSHKVGFHQGEFEAGCLLPFEVSLK